MNNKPPVKKRIAIVSSIILVGMVVSFFIYSAIPIITIFVNSNFHTGPYVSNLEDYKLNIRPYAEGLSFPTSMTFVDNNTIMALEKDGNVRLISNGVLQKEPILKVEVDSEAERGLLGIAALRKNSDKNETNLTNDNKINNVSKPPNSESDQAMPIYSVYLYLTEKIKDAKENSDYDYPNQTIRNRIYEYSWDGRTALTTPVLILDLPAKLGPYHNGGKLKIGPDNQLYAVIGDLVTINNTLQNLQSIGNHTGTPNNSSVIFRVDPSDGSIPKDNPFYKNYYKDGRLKTLIYYYAYGIRNSFGLDFDPLTAKLWDTENGEDKYDEINIVEPGFNSGWHKIMGPLARNDEFKISELVMFNGSHYSDPVFSWRIPIGITDIEFFNSSSLGKKYSNNVFVGDINNGNLYFFKVNDSRSGMDTNIAGVNKNEESLSDKVSDSQDESNKFTVAKGFDGRITDIETGPDGYLYILTYFDGKIYRIS
jgi:glucose/arabinose dehydrogenase